MRLSEIRQLTRSLSTWRQAVANGRLDVKDFSQSLTDYLAKLQAKTQAYITILPENKIRQQIEAAIKADKPLLGWPVSMKDVFITKEIKTTAGAAVLKDYLPSYSSTVYQRLVSAGGSLVAKTNCDAWGFGGSTENSDFYSSKNPYDLERVPGGSSGGSAVSVASGAVGFDIGEDTGGSIRQPAAFCGVIGFKPTYGSISRYGAIAFSSSLDTIGLFGRQIEDVIEVFNLVKGVDGFDATVYPSQTPTKITSSQQLTKIKIGYLPELFEGVDPQIKDYFDKLKVFYESELKAEFIEIKLPHFSYGLAVYYILAPAEASSNLGRYDGVRFGQGRQFFGDEAIRRVLLGTFALASGYYDAYYLKALKVRRLIYQDFIKAFNQVESILLPVTLGQAFKLGQNTQDPIKMYLEDSFTIPISLAGLPAISFPVGLSDQGLPLGLQFAGRHFNESTLAGLVKVWQSFSKFNQKYPNHVD